MGFIAKSTKRQTFTQWCQQGNHWVWVNAMSLCICILMVTALILLIFSKGFAHFWPAQVVAVDTLQDRQSYLGEKVDTEVQVQIIQGATQETQRTLFKVGNREDYSLDFKWLDDALIKQQSIPAWVAVVERHEWGNAYGKITSINIDATIVPYEATNFKQTLWLQLQRALDLAGEIHSIEKLQIGDVNKRFELLRIDEKKLAYEQQQTGKLDAKARVTINQNRLELQNRFDQLSEQLQMKRKQLQSLGFLTLTTIDGYEKPIAFSDIVRIYFPNRMNFLEKVQHYFSKMYEFIFTDPREANTEGGIFPAIFGTVVLVFMMTIFVTPLGVITAVYLREYAKQGLIVRLIRISVNNLAGVPSIVYGVFGLGFFVYFMGGKIDELFYSHSLPSPTFGSPNMLWASLTLALLTLPVVIVSTEEGLNRVPRSIREGSLALGATKFETIWRTVLPMTSPAIMTGLILAISRAAGEVAPLMLVGVVKLAPDLVIDTISPFVHLDRQFMHLGFHIYDVGFQSPNVEAARPLVYATATLLVLIIIALNLTAIRIRNRLRERYKSLDN